MKHFVEQVLAPRIQADGGWVEFVSYENETLTLLFRGECSKCQILDRCTDWISQQVSARFSKSVTIIPLRRKPYFWDN